MADLARIKRNVSKMVSMSAPETDIDQYIAEEGVTVDDVKNFKLDQSNQEQTKSDQKSVSRMISDNLKGAAEETYREIIAPFVHGASTFAAGIPKMISKGQDKRLGVNSTDMIFPEQKTAQGKLLRGVGEYAGFTTGLPGRAAMATGKLIGQGVKKLIPKASGKFLSKAIQGVGAGAAGMAAAGDTLESRKQGAKIGALIGGAATGVSPAIKWSFDKIGRAGSVISGIEKEVYEEAQKNGFRNVLKSKYYGKKLPEEIQDRIALNLDNMQSAAGDKYETLTEPLRKSSFDMAQFRDDVIKRANRIKMNPFDTDVSKLDNAILDGVANKAEIKTLGDALDLRRSLDDVIYSNKGELKSTFGKQVRDVLNKALHQNKDLKKVDADWTNFLDVLRDSKKILSDTGEKILARFGSMTGKQKQMLVELEKEIGGMPFVEDLTNWSIAKEFTTKTVSPNVSGVVRAVSKPVLRGYLRQGEKVVSGFGKFGKVVDRRLLGE
jgi:hypothetical protein